MEPRVLLFPGDPAGATPGDSPGDAPGDAGEAARNLSLTGLLAIIFHEELSAAAGRTRFALRFRHLHDTVEYQGPPTLVNLRSHMGYVDVTIFEGDRVIYRHPHSVTGLFGPALAAVAQRLDRHRDRWSFRIEAPELEADDTAEEPAATRQPPQVHHSGEVDIARLSRLSFGVRRAEEPEIPEIDLAEAGASHLLGTTAPVTVLLAPGSAQLLTVDMPLSEEVEEGGFLAGQVYRRADAPGLHAVLIEHVLRAEHTGASMLQFTFTGDSFRAMSRALAEQHPGAVLVGWYHTHLFAATKRPGLSQVDVDTHRDTFRRPWQVAALINIADGSRTLRCYAPGKDGEMEPCPLWSTDEQDEHGHPRRRRNTSLGHR